VSVADRQELAQWAVERRVEHQASLVEQDSADRTPPGLRT
jgi:hypothetical protein